MAIEYKKVMVNYVDKVVFVGFLVLFLVTAFRVVMKGPTDRIVVSPIPKNLPPSDPTLDKEQYVLKNFSDPPQPDATLDFTSDPEKIEPGPGEKQCPRCGWIVPRSTARCPRPNCGHSWGPVTPERPPENVNGPQLPIEGPPFRVADITRKEVDILFKGWARNPFIKNPAGKNQIDIQINWGENTRTKIVPLGESFHGYRLWPLELKEMTVERPGLPTTKEKVLFLTIQKKDSSPLVAEYRKTVRENEAMALLDVLEGKWKVTHRGETTANNEPTFEVYVQYRLQENGGQRRDYTVTEIKEKEIVLQAKDGKQEALKLTARKVATAPAK